MKKFGDRKLGEGMRPVKTPLTERVREAFLRETREANTPATKQQVEKLEKRLSAVDKQLARAIELLEHLAGRKK